MPNPLIVIPAYIANKKHAIALDKCVKSIRKTTESRIMIVDDNSPYEKQAMVLYDFLEKEFDGIDLCLWDKNEGFSHSVNQGLNLAQGWGDDALLVNADIEFFDDDWLDNLYKVDADIVGGLLLYPNNIIQHAGIYFSPITRNFDHRYKGAPGNLPAAQKECECPVTGALQLIKHNVLEDVGLYDEDFRLGYEDVDYMIRAIEKGHRSVYSPDVKAFHYESLFRGASSEKHDKWQTDSYKTLIKKHKDKNFYEIAPTMFEDHALS